MEKDRIVLIRDAAGEYRARAGSLINVRDNILDLLPDLEESEVLFWKEQAQHIEDQSRELTEIASLMEEICENEVHMENETDFMPDIPEASVPEFGTSFFGNLDEKKHLIPIHSD